MSDNEEALAFIEDQAKRLLDDAAAPEHLKWLLDNPGSFDHDLWRQTAELGWAAAAASESLGGLGMGWTALCRLTEQLGRTCVALPLVQNMLIVESLATAKGEHSKLIELLLAGEKVAAICLFSAGDNRVTDRPSTVLGDEGLTGRQAVTAFAAVADYALVYCQSGNLPCLAMVALQDAGVSVQRSNTIDNARAAATLEFDDAVAIPLCKGHDAYAAAQQIAARAAVAVAFEQIGGAQACLAAACDYARTRRVFGQAIGAFQGIKHKLADIYSDIEVARGCALDALACLESDSGGLLPYAAAARLAAITAYEHAARENIQVHGGIGVTWESPQHHFYRRSRFLALEWGSSQFWRDVLVDNVEQLAVGY